MLEEIKALLEENLSEVTMYAIQLVLAFLLFLFRAKINKTTSTTKTLFIDKVKEITQGNTELKTEVDAKLVLAIAEYKKITEEYKKSIEKINKLENTLLILLEGDENGKNTNTIDEEDK